MLTALAILGGAYAAAAVGVAIALGRAAKCGDEAMREAFAAYLHQQTQHGAGGVRLGQGAPQGRYRLPSTGHNVRAMQKHRPHATRRAAAGRPS